ncbi:SycD/LcrH family type III secretion system chaperone [Erwinia piriflorinigrans]|uniref:Chaperone protein sicA n=1 Tax=Erwinia piriflorinigrans CFBP 5888 TaxID=1161919 RepID=V5Z7R7_9GAMM|nr:SycD/LcrH family type III secretion system chaperone [Erwinia piriflorinigrans]CCG87075.1 Chaperone protein sicA [Erwinia piriflorinigrans CFBP 5888]
MEYESTERVSNPQDEIDSNTQLDEYSGSLIDAIQNGAVLKDVQGVSDETMHDIYKIAYDFYHQGKLDDAESLFRFLCIYDFYNSEYPMGLAAVYQLKKEYRKAIDFYALAFSLAEEDYRPMFYAGQCNLMLRNEALARKCFSIVIKRCQVPLLKEKAQTFISALNEINGSPDDLRDE